MIRGRDDDTSNILKLILQIKDEKFLYIMYIMSALQLLKCLKRLKNNLQCKYIYINVACLLVVY